MTHIVASDGKQKSKFLELILVVKKTVSYIEENFRERIATNKRSRIISVWQKRNLMVFGKIIVIKTFLIPQLMYFMQAFINPF